MVLKYSPECENFSTIQYWKNSSGSSYNTRNYRFINNSKMEESLDQQENTLDAIKKSSDETATITVNEDTKDNDGNATETKKNEEVNTQSPAEGFKKPVLLIGPRHGNPGKIRSVEKTVIKTAEEVNDNIGKQVDNVDINVEEPERDTVEKTSSLENKPSVDPIKDIPLAYTEPSWGGLPEKEYHMEVLKSGVILETIDLSERSFHVIGRLPSCHLSLAHPTISRYHAILQYRSTEDEKNKKGLYLYDLGSTHGTFWNGNRIRPNVYVRLHGGHMVRFGYSNRKYILQAPPEDEEEESELSVTELKEKRKLELEKRERMQRELEMQKEEEEKLRKEQEEKEGIDWGMGEDADEETDLTENPYATANDEELFLDDPKKTLRGWFEREGYDLQYQTEERGVGQFLCWVELPINTSTGRSVRAEALVKGKKKESVIQCALEACRILDRHGLLRQANHEARKRKTRSWEEQDYYDSDEDNFLDRTGTVEKKREQRMRQAGKLETKVETYSTLLEKHNAVIKQIQHLEDCLRSSKKSRSAESEDAGEDALDAFMSNLNSTVLSKHDIIKMKSELQQLRKEEENLIKLVNLARPANLPPLEPQTIETAKSSADNVNKSSENRNKSIGHIKKFKALSNKPVSNTEQSTVQSTEDNSCESESDEEANEKLKSADSTSIPVEDANDLKTIKMTKDTSTNKDNNCMDTDRTADAELVTDTQDEENASVSTTEASDKAKDESSEMEKTSGKQRKRNKKKLDKATKEMEKLYDQNVHREDYSTWVPPQNQTGDGKTSLNAKFGY